MSIVIIGIIKNWKKKGYIKESMRRMAGEKGKVLMYQDFDELSRKFDEVLAKACRKLVFLFFLPELVGTEFSPLLCISMEHIKCSFKTIRFYHKGPRC